MGDVPVDVKVQELKDGVEVHVGGVEELRLGLVPLLGLLRRRRFFLARTYV